MKEDPELGFRLESQRLKEEASFPQWEQLPG